MGERQLKQFVFGLHTRSAVALDVIGVVRMRSGALMTCVYLSLHACCAPLLQVISPPLLALILHSAPRA